MITELKEALGSGDLSRFARLAHTLKGSARSIGANAFAEVALELEQAGKAGRVEGVESTLALLEQHLQAIEAFAQTFTLQQAA